MKWLQQHRRGLTRFLAFLFMGIGGFCGYWWLYKLVPGSSAYVLGGIIAYANAVKVQELGVKEASLEVHGEVSEVVAMEMADGVRKRLGANWGISITGIAGPGGGTKEKPVGLFYVGIASDEAVRAVRYQVNGDRQQIRDYGIQRELEVLWRGLKGTQS